MPFTDRYEIRMERSLLRQRLHHYRSRTKIDKLRNTIVTPERPGGSDNLSAAIMYGVLLIILC